jgi:spore coat protein CotH
MYVAVEVGYDGHTWWHVGMRYKGNSSLSSLFREGNGKLPFRLNFDRFEDEFPEIDDQRFYGFGELTFGANWNDDSQIRECFVTEVFRDGGIQAARCAFYRVFVDVGEGSEYWGLYSMVEDPSDGAMLDSQFGGRGGNLYKPEGEGANWTHFSTEGFVKKTNEEEADWSDVEAAIAALHADRSDAPTWRQNLEATFDVDHFLTWLALNTAIQNWDSYGSMAHNYYIYADPGTSGKLVWIPWDHNLAMMTGMGGGGFGDFGTAQNPTSEVFHVSAGTAWPLISFLLADDIYSARYRELLVDALGGLFDLDLGPARMREMHTLITPYVVGPDGERPSHTTISSEAAFVEAIDGVGGLAEHVQQRHTLVLEALAATP